MNNFRRDLGGKDDKSESGIWAEKKKKYATDSIQFVQYLQYLEDVMAMATYTQSLIIIYREFSV